MLTSFWCFIKSDSAVLAPFTGNAMRKQIPVIADLATWCMPKPFWISNGRNRLCIRPSIFSCICIARFCKFFCVFEPESTRLATDSNCRWYMASILISHFKTHCVNMLPCAKLPRNIHVFTGIQINTGTTSMWWKSIPDIIFWNFSYFYTTCILVCPYTMQPDFFKVFGIELPLGKFCLHRGFISSSQLAWK